MSHDSGSSQLESAQRTYRRTLRDIGPSGGRAHRRKVAGHGRPPRRDSERGKHRVCEEREGCVSGGVLDEEDRNNPESRQSPEQINRSNVVASALVPRRAQSTAEPIAHQWPVTGGAKKF